MDTAAGAHSILPTQHHPQTTSDSHSTIVTHSTILTQHYPHSASSPYSIIATQHLICAGLFISLVTRHLPSESRTLHRHTMFMDMRASVRPLTPYSLYHLYLFRLTDTFLRLISFSLVFTLLSESGHPARDFHGVASLVLALRLRGGGCCFFTHFVRPACASSLPGRSTQRRARQPRLCASSCAARLSRAHNEAVVTC